MEKVVRTISLIVTSVLVYVFFAYSYLSWKGFVWTGNGFDLIAPAQAAETPEEQSFATPIAPDVALNFSSSDLIGNPDAPLTLYELSSLSCVHCADFHLHILPKLKEDFISKNLLNVVFVNFPLEKKAMQAAMLSECLKDSQRENFLNKLFSRQRSWVLSADAENVLIQYALDEGLDKAAAEECLKNDSLAQQILATRQEGIDKLNMQGTPAFLISGGGRNEIIYGVPNYDELKAYLEERGAK